MPTKTYIPKQDEIEKKWFLIDAKDQVLGRLAVKVSRLLTGKGKPIYTPHLECGDHVVVINAKKIRVTGNKIKDKMYSHYTGYPGGLRQYNFETLLAKKPEEVIIRAVERMLPKNRMGAKMIKHLHVYSDETHTQQAQKPVSLK
jgi:large subunit ribosomal protein L13